MKKRWHVILYIIFFISSLEVMSFVYLFVFEDQARLAAYEFEQEQLFSRSMWFEKHSAHPFLTYSRSELVPELIQVDSDTVNVAIIGGSVARGFGEYLIEGGSKEWATLVSELGKPIKLFNLAVGGYKQPQQYFQSLLVKEKFDLFISLEGYNELFFRSIECAPQLWNTYFVRYSDSWGLVSRLSVAVFNNLLRLKLWWRKRALRPLN